MDRFSFLQFLGLQAGDDVPDARTIEAPMAIVILGGLMTATFLNMIVVPALYLRFGKPLESS